MRKTFVSILLVSLAALFSCRPSTTESEETEKDPVELPCESSGTQPPPYSFSSTNLGKLVRLVADGDSVNAPQKLEVLLIESCKLLFEQRLPNSLSAESTYSLANLEYNSAHHLVGISGNRAIYALQADSLFLVGPLEPTFAHQTMAADAQSGQILHLEVWEDFLVGYSQDFGSFVFDFRQPQRPSGILPFREWELESGHYHSLFLLPSGDNLFQALLPVFDFESGTIRVESFFPKPVEMNVEDQPQVEEGSPMIELIHSGGEHIEINLASGKAVQ